MSTEFDLLTALAPSRSDTGRQYGVVIGIVTNNQDPDELGRVKLRFPWLSDQYESNWARVATPMAGADRGLYWLPEIDDEVLVAFEHGRIEFPYLLGGLWNGKDVPIEKNDQGKNNVRMLRSRSGHTIKLDDSAGAERIEVWDKSEKNRLTIDTAKNTITIVADSDITINSVNGKIILSGKGVDIRSDADVSLNASSSATLKASGQMTIKGATIALN
jgi:uncharacterized protein involved in type VI secretion and phage assembly